MSQNISLTPKCKELISDAARLLVEKSENVETNEKIWDKISDELLVIGVQKEKVSTELRKLVENKIKELEPDLPENAHTKLNTGQYYRWVRKKGFQDPAFQLRKEESLPSGNGTDTSSEEINKNQPFAILRNQLINIVDDMISQMRKMRSDLKKDFIIDEKLKSKENPEGKKIIDWSKFFQDKETEELFKVMKTLLIAAAEENKQLMDSRQIILPTDRFLSLAIIHFVGKKWYGKNWHSVVKEKVRLTPKKLLMFLQEEVSYSKLISYTMIEPLNLHFLDIKCPECGKFSLKTMWHKGGTWNIVCTNEEAHESQKLYFPSTLIDEQLGNLLYDKKTATEFLEKHHITIPDNEPKKKK